MTFKKTLTVHLTAGQHQAQSQANRGMVESETILNPRSTNCYAPTLPIQPVGASEVLQRGMGKTAQKPAVPCLST